MTKTSLCGLGQAAANPVMSSLNYFLAEYEAHIGLKFCGSAVCTELYEYTILADLCTGCGMCRKVCEASAIQGERKQLHTLDTTKCVKCKACVHACAYHAIVGVPLGTQEKSGFLQEAAL
jgi:Na+-translocating ferredoxin:NAD+ oxidoreductase RNF subunit RnfB